MNLAKNIRFLRSKLGYSEVDFSNLFDRDMDWLNLLETGKKDPTIDELSQLAKELKVTIDDLIHQDLVQLMSLKDNSIEFVVLDVDGVMTDGGMYYTENGDQIKKFNTKDGRALFQLKKYGFKTGFLSSGITHQMIQKRAEVLGVDKVHVGRNKKIEILKKWCAELDLELNQVAYIGDDINDLDVIEHVGLSACPADAMREVKQAVQIVLHKKGGEGCVREFVEDYLFEQID